jgi:hypothetical protein
MASAPQITHSGSALQTDQYGSFNQPTSPTGGSLDIDTVIPIIVAAESPGPYPDLPINPGKDVVIQIPSGATTISRVNLPSHFTMVTQATGAGALIRGFSFLQRIMIEPPVQPPTTTALATVQLNASGTGSLNNGQGDQLMYLRANHPILLRFICRKDGTGNYTVEQASDEPRLQYTVPGNPVPGAVSPGVLLLGTHGIIDFGQAVGNGVTTVTQRFNSPYLGASDEAMIRFMGRDANHDTTFTAYHAINTGTGIGNVTITSGVNFGADGTALGKVAYRIDF